MKYNFEKIDREFKTIEKSTLEGNHGKARVCARRAVLFAMQEKLRPAGNSVIGLDLQQLSKLFLEEFETSEEIKNILNHMSWKVDMKLGSDSTYWPYPEVDLIKEARYFVDYLLSD
jgi:hypothetical protein